MFYFHSVRTVELGKASKTVTNSSAASSAAPSPVPGTASSMKRK